MKKVLIISYHFPPLNVIASRRAEAYAMFLPDHGIDVTVLTHRWELDDIGAANLSWKFWNSDTSIVYEKVYNYKVIRVPRYKTIASKIISFFEVIPFLSKIVYLASWLWGHLDGKELYSYFNFKSFLWRHLTNNQYDMVLAIFTPHNHIRLGYEIKKKFGIPFVADYRDLWDNDLLSKNDIIPHLPIGGKMYDAFSLKSHKKWLQESLFFTSVSQPIVDKLGYLCQIENGYCITNGYEESVFSKLVRQYSQAFIILHGGAIYEGQDLSGFIKGLKLFWNNLPTEDKLKVKVLFLATKTRAKVEELNEFLPEVNIEFKDRVPRDEAIQLMKDASILFYPGWTTTSGIYSGKIFEYLGANSNILVVPSDHDVVEDLITRTGAGIITDSPEEMAVYIGENFTYWKKHNKSDYRGRTEIIKESSREFQVAKMARLIHDHLNKIKV